MRKSVGKRQHRGKNREWWQLASRNTTDLISKGLAVNPFTLKDNIAVVI
jgi:hypothetical protein